MLGIISKIFGGNKSEKDVKLLQPIVEQVNQHVAAFRSLSNDQLRAKTAEFKTRIKGHLGDIDTEISDLNKKAEELPFSDIGGKDTLYTQIDELKKARDKQIETILKEILPEAFAVVKETARRFKENTEIIATATELDKDLSIKKDHIHIEGEQSIYKNTWTAAGGQITWNMVHYDVQLIGGPYCMKGRLLKWLPVKGKHWFRPFPPISMHSPEKGYIL